ncbi:MAG TPA: large conductance mechanosensitive channel protein MscL [Candidatus Binatia bacterium]|jgi:large conductance mechanosensitive channel|nr:large conductance mechanosensitive channel protein MscL [Candidatus Binatia bacterium]
MANEEQAGIHKHVLKPTRKFIDDFRQFAVRGNAFDLAVGVVIGAAFGKIITSFVTDIITPPISLLMGRANFTDMFAVLSGGSFATLDEAKKAGAITVNYGVFISTLFDFVLVSFVIFLLVRALSRMRREDPPPSDMKDCPFCLTPVKKAATRCAFCTSDLAPKEQRTEVRG